MTDVWFIVAGWGVILGGLALYAGILVRRLAAARDAEGGLSSESAGRAEGGE